MRDLVRNRLDVQQHQLPLDSLGSTAERHVGSFCKGVWPGLACVARAMKREGASDRLKVRGRRRVLAELARGWW